MSHQIEVKVTGIEQLTDQVKSFTFTALKENQLPPFSAGAHIGVQIDPDTKRAYSLTSSPANTEEYSIAVQLEQSSKGGSKRMHESVQVGDVLQIEPPNNFFELSEDNNAKHIFIAGGIGITPFISYIHQLENSGLNYELHYCFRHHTSAAFLDFLQQKLGERLVTHESDSGERLDIKKLAEQNDIDTHFYVCGPNSLIDDTINFTSAYVGESNVHYEKFTDQAEEGESFEVYCEKSDITLQIAEDQSIIQVLEADKRIKVDCLCRNGVCGTCETTILQGEADHRDSYLTDEEREEQKTMLICVSRAKSKRIVLDL